MIFMEISPGCQMGMNFKTLRTACSAFSYPNSLHLSFSVIQHTFLVKLLANGSTFLVFWADETFLISEIIFFRKEAAIQKLHRQVILNFAPTKRSLLIGYL